MQPEKTLSTETIEKVAVELLGLEIDPAERAGVAGLLDALAADMHALRGADVGTAEPAITYEAVEQ